VSGGELAWRIDRDGAVTTFMLHGRLDFESAAPLRAGLLRCLAECPAAIVVDISTTQIDDDLALLVFPSVVREGAGFPPATLMLCGAGEARVPRLAQLGITDQVRLFPSRAAARAAAHASATDPAALSRRLATRLSADHSAPAQGRALVERACREWRLPDLVPAAQIVVSELCANAVDHGRPPLRLVVARCGARLHVVVRDGSGQLPRLRRRPTDGEPMESGNGLHLVAAFAGSWGVQPTVDGKAVWATLAGD
jgi:anti-sigma regulatory factor (Ser/Thr protein kinase)